MDRPTTVRLPVTHETSTVLGYEERVYWDCLVWNGMEYADHGPHMFAGNYGYLHVLATEEPPPSESQLSAKTLDDWWEADGVVYRVRPRSEPGGMLNGRKVIACEVEKTGVGPTGWEWIIELDPATSP